MLLQTASKLTGGTHGGLKAWLSLGVGQIDICGVDFLGNLRRTGEGGANSPMHAHHSSDELHGEVGVVHGLGRCQNECARRVKARAGRLLEDENVLRGVVGNLGHHHRIRVISRMLSDAHQRNTAHPGQGISGGFDSVRAVAHLNQEQRLDVHAGIFERAG